MTYRRFDDHLNDIVTFELEDGRRVNFEGRMVRELGAAACLERVGVEAPKGRLPVWQHGQVVGSLPASFDPLFIQSRTFLYDPRPGDFRRDEKGWIASAMLGQGDLDAIIGFKPQ